MQPEQHLNEQYLQQSDIEFKIQLQNSGFNNTQLCVCDDCTFVVLDSRLFGDSNYLNRVTAKHITKTGQLIKQLYLGQFSYAKSYMITGQAVIFGAFNKTNQSYFIIQWDLVTNQSVTINTGSSWYTDLFVFPATGLICTVQRSNNNQDYLASTQKLLVKINYYKYPLTSPSDPPAYTLSPPQTHPLSYFDTPSKLNNKQSLIWRKRKQRNQPNPIKQNYLTIHILNINKDQIKIKSYALDIKSEGPLYDWTIADVWEVRDGVLYVKCVSQLDYVRCRKERGKLLGEEEARELFGKEKVGQWYWYYKCNKIEVPKFRQNKKEMQKQHIVQFSSGMRNIGNIVQVQNNQKYLTTYLQNKGYTYYKLVDIYYVDAETDQIICIQKIKQNQSQCYHFNLYSFSFPAHQGMIVRYRAKSQKDGIKTISARIIKINSILSCCKISIISNCEQDLLYFTVQLLETKSSNNQRYEWKIAENIQHRPLPPALDLVPSNNSSILEKLQTSLQKVSKKIVQIFHKKQQK